jgi:hypothetical protein
MIQAGESLVQFKEDVSSEMSSNVLALYGLMLQDDKLMNSYVGSDRRVKAD